MTTEVSKPSGNAKRPCRKSRTTPTHYRIICISLYTDDLKRLDSMVDALKARGLTKASRSALIRYALGKVDPEAVPREMDRHALSAGSDSPWS